MDAFVTHPEAYGHVLASDGFGSNTEKFELIWDAENDQKDIMAVPGVCLEAEYWRDADDHSKGFITRPVRMVRFVRDASHKPRLEPVGFTLDRESEEGFVKLVNASAYSNFKQFVT